MNKYLRYLKAQFKRTLKVYPVILAFTVMLTACVLVLLSSMFAEDADSVQTSRIRVGLVGDTSESYLDIGISAVQQFDSTKYYIEFVNLEQETEAETLLKSGDIFGYIVIPDGFVESVVSGENKHLKYVADNSPATLGPLLMNEVVKLVSDLLVEAQSGIYAMIDVGESKAVDDEAIDAAVERLNLKYISSVLDRESYYKVEFIGIGDGLGFVDYYYHAFFVLLMMLWGMTCISLRIRHDMSLPRLLKSRGVGTFGQTVCDYIPFFLIIYVSALVLTYTAAVFGKGMGLGFAVSLSGVADYAMLAVKLIPAVAVISAMQFLLYEVSTNIISGVLLQLVATVALAYASGFFYPLSSFPISVQNLAGYLPTRTVFGYTSTVFTGGANTSALIGCVLYFCAFILLSFAVRTYKMRSDRL